MLLIPEQIYEIKKVIVETNKRMPIYYEDMINGKEISGFENTNMSAQKNNPSQEIYNILKNRVKELERIISVSHIIEKRNLDSIDIGTYFYYKWIDEDEIESAYLVEQNPLFTIDNKFISIESPIGKSIIGAKEGDIIKIKLLDNSSVQLIQIIKISKKKDDYIQLISSNYKEEEITNIEKTIKNNTDNSKNNLLITESQIRLIKNELKKLKDNIDNIDNIKEKRKIRRKISFFNKMLKMQINDTPNDSTIGIGSIVDFSLNNGYFYSLEFIARAYTTEYPCQYVEYNSNLGKALYGKKAGDKFAYKSADEKIYTGKILKVYNKDYEEIDPPKTYKKLNS